MQITIPSLILGIAFAASLMVAIPALTCMFHLWGRLERELVDPKPITLSDAMLMWDPAPERFSLQGRVLIPPYLKWQRIGIAGLFVAGICGPFALWLSK
jgi:hypothetical protein